MNQESHAIWLHEDMLSTAHPVFEQADFKNEKPLSFFIWDQEYFKAQNYSLKRLVFLYETLCALPLEIYKGPHETVFKALIDAHGITDLWTGTTPNTVLIKQIEALENKLNMHVIDQPSFINLDKEPDLKRFSRYWNRAKKKALNPTDRQGDLFQT